MSLPENQKYLEIGALVMILVHNIAWFKQE